ncbi:MAG: hypothetical protein CMM02_05245 [Rhodopirellula sp.]|nr:hypothetical protein [Rhodopirellula sp.]
MNIPKPKRIRVLNLSWKIEFVNEAISQASNSLGWCDYERQTISLFEGQPDQQMADTFLHEVLHSIFYGMGIDVTKDLDEEDLVQKISTGLCTVWAANPNAFRWFQSLL